ncbi:hypothetical protein SDC9_71305 [bioreactor metagenome]|uniref:Uncharacterized protein n=1 Tax=bioreactor metagenome TaxID=1076179 RepID=A0A644Y935_9ZZZZ
MGDDGKQFVFGGIDLNQFVILLDQLPVLLVDFTLLFVIAIFQFQFDGKHGLELAAVGIDDEIDQHDDDDRDQSAQPQIDQEGMEDVLERVFIRFAYQQYPVEFRDITRIDIEGLAADPIFQTGGMSAENFRRNRQEAGNVLDVFAFAIVGGKDDFAFRRSKIDNPVEPFVIAFNNPLDIADFEADAGGTDVIAVEVENLVVDENGHGVLVGLIGIDVDFVIGFHAADAEIPAVLGVVVFDGFQNAFGLIIQPGALGNEKAGERVVFALGFVQKLGDLSRFFLAGDHPVAQKRIIGHQ